MIFAFWRNYNLFQYVCTYEDYRRSEMKMLLNNTKSPLFMNSY